MYRGSEKRQRTAAEISAARRNGRKRFISAAEKKKSAYQ